MNENKTMIDNPLMPHLPEEIIMDIHSRLPPISLLKFRCVSKSWSVLFNNPKLIDMIKFSLSIMIVCDSNMYSIDSKSLSSSSSSLLDCIQKIPRSDDNDYYRMGLLDGIDVFNNKNYSRTNFVGCSNGLFCLHINDRKYNFSWNFRIWNPSTGDCKKIPTPPDYTIEGYNPAHDLSTMEGYGFGYDSKSDDFKFVCLVNYFKLNQFKANIYSVRSASWKQFKRTQKTPGRLFLVSPKYGVFCNGAFHWQSLSLSGDEIIALHMADEQVRGISPPKTDFDAETHIDVLDGCLSYSVNLGFEVWLMKDYGNKESWTKLYSISKLKSLEMGRSGCLRRIMCLKSGEILLEVRYYKHGCYRKALLLYDPYNEMSMTLIEDEDDTLSFHSCVKN